MADVTRLSPRIKAPNEGAIALNATAASSVLGIILSGELAEWFKAMVLKTIVGETLPGVRIPRSPPATAHSHASLNNVGLLPKLVALLRRQSPSLVAMNGVALDLLAGRCLLKAAGYSARFFAVWTLCGEVIAVWICHLGYITSLRLSSSPVLARRFLGRI